MVDQAVSDPKQVTADLNHMALPLRAHMQQIYHPGGHYTCHHCRPHGRDYFPLVLIH